jgi:hypothetical protein
MPMSFNYAMITTECGQMKVFLSDEWDAFETLRKNTISGGESFVLLSTEPHGIEVMEQSKGVEVEVISAFDGEDESNRKGPL